MSEQAASQKKKFKLPHLGMRIVKTGICVFFCLLLNYLFSPQVALISSLAAIVAMQSSLEGTLKTGIGRLVGTAVGGGAALAMMPLAQDVEIEWVYVILMPIGMILIIYLCVMIGVPQSASICAFVYIAVLIVPFNPNSRGDPYMQGVIRIADTAVGVVIALLVNRFIAPPKPKPVTSISILSNSYNEIYERVKDQLSGIEELLLVDTTLIDPQTRKDHPDIVTGGIPIRACTDTVSIPVPTEFKKIHYIDTAYIGADYKVTEIYLRQMNGYVQLPCETFPATVVWHVDRPTSHETYGLFRGARKFRQLRRADQQVRHRLRLLRPSGRRLKAERIAQEAKKAQHEALKEQK